MDSLSSLLLENEGLLVDNARLRAEVERLNGAQMHLIKQCEELARERDMWMSRSV